MMQYSNKTKIDNDYFTKYFYRYKIKKDSYVFLNINKSINEFIFFISYLQSEILRK